jgi:cell division septum initiation protein DivIVA
MPEISEIRFEHRKKMGLLTYEDLVHENDELKKRVEQLEEEIACAYDHAASVEATARRKDQEHRNHLSEIQRATDMQEWEYRDRIESLERRNERCRLENRKLKASPGW